MLSYFNTIAFVIEISRRKDNAKVISFRINYIRFSISLAKIDGSGITLEHWAKRYKRRDVRKEETYLLAFEYLLFFFHVIRTRLRNNSDVRQSICAAQYTPIYFFFSAFEHDEKVFTPRFTIWISRTPLDGQTFIVLIKLTRQLESPFANTLFRVSRPPCERTEKIMFSRMPFGGRLLTAYVLCTADRDNVADIIAAVLDFHARNVLVTWIHKQVHFSNRVIKCERKISLSWKCII